MAGLTVDLVGSDNCAFYAEQRDYEQVMLRRYNTIILCISITVAASLVGLIIAVAVQNWGVTAATGIGTILSGTAMKFILDQRASHQDRINKWVKAIEDNCGGR